MVGLGRIGGIRCKGRPCALAMRRIPRPVGSPRQSQQLVDVSSVYKSSMSKKRERTMNASTQVGDDWIARCEQLSPVIAQWREVATRNRCMPAELFQALRDAGMFRLSTAEALGGAEVDEGTAVRTIEALSRQDGAVGWNVMVASNTAMIASYLPPATRAEIYRNDPSTFVAGALLPKGTATSIAGGYRLTGRWVMASGVHNAQWMVACSTVTEYGAARLRSDGSPDVRTFFLPKQECEVLDTWHTLGMQGTGSHDWQVRDVFVPEAYSFPVILQGQRSEETGLFVHDFASFAVARVAAVALGIARDAIDSFIDLAKSKVPTVSASKLAVQHTVHEQVGRAEALVRAGRAALYEAVRELPYNATWSEELTDDQRASVRLAAALAAQNSAAAVSMMFNAAGTSGIYSGTRLNRCFCDVHVASQHINVAPSNIEMVGQHLLGFGMHLRR